MKDKVSNKNRQNISENPFSNGGGGYDFEGYIQASFVLLMLTKRFAPCLPCWPISKIKLQGRFDGYNTDDLIVFVERPGSKETRKLLGQVKHTIRITKNDPFFTQVIRDAWKDFNNHDLFKPGKDAIALLTGPVSATDSQDVPWILNQAKYAGGEDEFFKNVEQTNFISESKRNKLAAFKAQLKKANNNTDVSRKDLYSFLKCFHFLNYDLGEENGIILSLLYSLMSQFDIQEPRWIYSRIYKIVKTRNKYSGTLSCDNILEEEECLKKVFIPKTNRSIPEDLVVKNLLINQDLTLVESNQDLIMLNLIGSWDENSNADREIISEITGKKYESWIISVRNFLQKSSNLIILKNGKWSITKRKELWEVWNKNLYDDHLKRFEQCVVRVFKEKDPQFDLPIEKRFAANIFGKKLKYSSELRKGLAESLALLGNTTENLMHCSPHMPKMIAQSAINKIFSEADWVLWGSLDELLPILAEVEPDCFLNAVENALRQSPCPVDILFQQERNGFLGKNYLVGLLWALETLAWEELFLVRVCVILGELATHDPGGHSANRPMDSLVTILLPWHPQTTASIDKQRVVVKTLQRENPIVAWELLLSLLPNPTQMSMGSHKPSWRKSIPDENKINVTKEEYWKQVTFYAGLTVSIATSDREKSCELIDSLDFLPPASLEKFLDYLSSQSISSQSMDENFALWSNLKKMISKHKISSDAQWALDKATISKIEFVAEKLAPSNPLKRYQRLFTNRDSILYEENGSYEEKYQKLAEKRQQAISDIFAYGGVDSVIQFAKTIETPGYAGESFSSIAKDEFDKMTLPNLLKISEEKLMPFTNAYIRYRQREYSWEWVDKLDKSNWSVAQMSQLLIYLSFEKKTWNRVTEWLGKSEKEYWCNAGVAPDEIDRSLDFTFAVDKLLEYNRPCAAIRCLHELLYKKGHLDKSRSIKALLAVVSSTEQYVEVKYAITELIKALQKDSEKNVDALLRIEWAYLPLQNNYSGYNNFNPKTLEKQFAYDAAFFCEMIRSAYRSTKKSKTKKNLSKQDKAAAENAHRLLRNWHTPPGTQPDNTFSPEQLIKWVDDTKKISTESGHLEAALQHTGKVLIHCPPDPNGLWIHHSAAEILNENENEKMRKGFFSSLISSRGPHKIDPKAKPERDLALKCRQKAEVLDNEGYQRFSVTMRSLAEFYDYNADRILNEYGYTYGQN